MASATKDLRHAIKGDDAWFATFVAAPIANRILGRIEHTRVTPNQLTLASMAAAAFAAASFALASYPALLVGALAIQISFVLDCLDGQLARHREQTSAFGAWLDLMGDYLQDVLLVAGIAWGVASREGNASAFLWGYATIFVVYYRHFDSVLLARTLGEGYVMLLRSPTRRRDDEAKVEAVERARVQAQRRWGAFERFLDRLAPKGTHEPRRLVFWTKRALLLSGGERYAVVSALAVANHPEWILPVIAVWGALVYPLISIRRWSLFGKA